MMHGTKGTILRSTMFLLLAVMVASSLHMLSGDDVRGPVNERLYFPSGKFLAQSAVGFREAMADYLWFRFIQYYGGFAKSQNDFRYFDLLIDGITRLDPKFVEAYHFSSLVTLSDFGDLEKSLDYLKRGILHNPDSAKLAFQVGFNYYVFYKQYKRAAFWFNEASKCSDATDKERRFAAFAVHRAGDERVSLALWEDLMKTTKSPRMVELAEKMILKTQNRIFQFSQPSGFVGPMFGQ
jgi:tetratricopeptide (TPR) repeat protein